MKKLLAIALTAIMLAMMVAPMTVSAAGVLLFYDPFDEPIIDNWTTDNTLFECVDGHLEGFHDAVVHQTQYMEEYGEDGAEGNKKWGTGTSFKVECWAFDADSAGDDLRQGLWWADYFETTYDWEGRITYTFFYNFVADQFTLEASFEKSGIDLYPDPDELPDVPEGEEPPSSASAVLEVADGPDFKMDMNNADHYTLGMKIDNGVIYCYCNDQQIFAHQAERGALCGAEAPSPFLLWNRGLWCAFDNAQASTADYGLFGETAVTEAPGTDAPVVTEPQTTAIVERVETVINEEGEVETRIVTEIITNAPAPVTQKQPTGGNTSGGAQTGDMAVIVIAVMVAALGAAVVVKKVND